MELKEKNPKYKLTQDYKSNTRNHVSLPKNTIVQLAGFELSVMTHNSPFTLVGETFIFRLPNSIVEKI